MCNNNCKLVPVNNKCEICQTEKNGNANFKFSTSFISLIASKVGGQSSYELVSLKSLLQQPNQQDDINFFENGRRPQFFENGRRPQFFFKWKTTSIFGKLEHNLIFWKMEDNLNFLKMEGDLNFLENGR